MSASLRPARCGFCGSRFCQRPGPGRPRRYCDTACRRRAQRQRDAARTRAADPPADARPPHNCVSLLTRLLHAEQQPLSLEALLGLAAGVDEEARRYAAAVTQQAVGPGPGSTHSRWNPVKDIQPTSAATPFSRTEPSPRERSRAARRLGAALTQLRAGSQSTLRDAARQSGLPLSVTAQVLSGAHVPPWPVVHLLATVFQGEPADLRALWESSQPGAAFAAVRGRAPETSRCPARTALGGRPAASGATGARRPPVGCVRRQNSRREPHSRLACHRLSGLHPGRPPCRPVCVVAGSAQRSDRPVRNLPSAARTPTGRRPGRGGEGPVTPRPPTRASFAMPNPPDPEMRRLLQAPRRTPSSTKHLGIEFRAFCNSRRRPYLAYADTRATTGHPAGPRVETALAELAGLWSQALRSNSPKAVAWYVLGSVIAEHHGQDGDLIHHVWQRRQADAVLLHHRLGLSTESAADLMGICTVDVAVLLTGADRSTPTASSTPRRTVQTY